MLFFRFIVTTFFVSTLLTPALAGELANFKESAQQQDEESKDQHQSNHNEEGDDDLGEVFLGAVVEILSIGAGESVDRLYQNGESGRRPGEALIPFFRLDMSHQTVNTDIEAEDYRLEMGWGPVALQIAKTSYTEDSAEDQLDLISTILLLRSSLGDAVEIDLGVGMLNIDNNPDDARVIVTLPILIHPSEHIGIELRPSWTDQINDMDAALLLGSRHISLKLGYRLVATNHSSLSGPYVGLSLRY